MQHITIGDKV